MQLMIRTAFVLLLAAFVATTSSAQGTAMDERTFWSLIEASRKNAENDQGLQFDQMYRALSALSKDDLVSFYRTYRDLKDKAYTHDLWAAAYIINGGCSDDCFDYFRAWLVAQGEQVFANALRDPETLIGIVVPYHTEFEDFNYVAWDVYERRFGGVIPFEPTNPELTGDDWDEGSVDDKYPRLAAWIKSQ